jgi:hypothetical protein
LGSNPADGKAQKRAAARQAAKGFDFGIPAIYIPAGGLPRFIVDFRAGFCQAARPREKKYKFLLPKVARQVIIYSILPITPFSAVLSCPFHKYIARRRLYV